MSPAARLIHEFELRAPSADGEMANLFRAGMPVGQVEGSVMEGQFAMAYGYLLLISAGRPFEESLYIVWLNAKLECLDQLELAAPYTAGAVTDIELGPGAELRFSFFGKDRWLLRLINPPRRRNAWSAFWARPDRPVRRLTDGRSNHLVLSREI